MVMETYLVTFILQSVIFKVVKLFLFCLNVLLIDSLTGLCISIYSCLFMIFFQNISFTTYNAQNKCVMDIQGKRQINTYEMVQTKSGVPWLTVSEWNNTNHTQVSWDFCVFLVLKMKWGVFLWFGKSWWILGDPNRDPPRCPLCSRFLFKTDLKKKESLELLFNNFNAFLSGFLTILGIVHQND